MADDIPAFDARPVPCPLPRDLQYSCCECTACCKPGMSASVVIVVLGARSGTSALVGTLGMLGATLPKRLMGAHSSNLKGHFEPEDIASLHDLLLAEIGSAWDDYRAFPHAWYLSSAMATHLARLRAAFLENYGDFSLAVLKEPRMIRFLPLWWRLLKEMNARPAPILAYRDPFEVAQSLAARDASTKMHGLRYWLRNQLDAESLTRGMTRSFVLFDELLNDWRRVVSRIEMEMRIHLPAHCKRSHAEVDAFLDPTLRHQHRCAPRNVGIDVLGDWAQTVFECFNVLRAEPTDHPAMRELDHIRAAFESAMQRSND